jgi:hypothetical protein
LHNSSVIDTATGLHWHRCADLANGEVSWDAALAGIAALNGSAGPGSWRLPNINELESLVHCGHARPALAMAADVLDLPGAVYWSSNTSMYEPDWAWALYPDKGAVGVGHKLQGRFSVWAVRSDLQNRADASVREGSDKVLSDGLSTPRVAAMPAIIRRTFTAMRNQDGWECCTPAAIPGCNRLTATGLCN